MDQDIQQIHDLETTANHLQSQIARLKIQDFDSREEFLRRKNILEKRKSKLSRKASKLRLERDKQEQKQRGQDTIQIVKQNKHLIILEINGIKTPIPNDLLINTRYLPCNHKIQMSLIEFLRYKTSIKSNIQLFHQWKYPLETGGIIEGVWYCDECRKQKDSRLRKLGFRRDTPVGHLRWSIKIIK